MKTKKTKRAPALARARPIQFTTPESYLAAVPKDKRVALEALRKTIQAIVPEADECISYNLPAFRLQGRFFVAYGAGAKHCAFYAGSVVQKLSDYLKKYDISKGTVRFAADKPLPASLVRKLIKERLRDQASRADGLIRARRDE